MSKFTFNGIVCADPRMMLDHLSDKGMEPHPDLYKANSFTYRIGVDPSEGYLCCSPLAVNSAPTGLSILCASDDPTESQDQASKTPLVLKNLGVEWATQLVQSPSNTTGMYLVKLTDKRLKLQHVTVGKSFNEASYYDASENTFVFVEGTSAGLRTAHPWQYLFDTVAAAGGIEFTAYPTFPNYIPLGIDFRYTTARDALQMLCEWAGVVVVPNDADQTFKLEAYIDIGSDYEDRHTVLRPFQIWNSAITNSTGDQVPDEFILHHRKLGSTATGNIQYDITVENPAAPSSSLHSVSLRLPTYSVPGASFIPAPYDYSVASVEWIQRIDPYLSQFPVKERRYGHFHLTQPSGNSLSVAIEQVSWDYNDTLPPSTEFQSVLFPEWLAKPYELDSVPPSQSSNIIRFQLRQDKSLSQLTVAADLIDEFGNVTEVVTLFDREFKFQGYGPYTDPQTNIAKPGYRGYAVSAQEQYSILIMEGNARYVEGIATQDYNSTSDAKGVCTVDRYWGAYPNNRKPKIYLKQYGGSTSEDPIVNKFVLDYYDPVGLAKDTPIKIDDKIIVVWDENELEYVLFVAPKGSNVTRVKGNTDRTVNSSLDEVKLTNVVGVDQPGSFPDITLSILDYIKMDCPSGTEIFASKNVTLSSDWDKQWDNGDMANHYWIMRGHAGWDKDKKQTLVSYGGTYPDMKWATMLDTYVLTSLQDIALSWPGNSSIKVLLTALQRGCYLIEREPPQSNTQSVESTLAGQTCNIIV